MATHRLGSADGWTTIAYTPEGNGVVMIAVHEIDDGTVETGPSCRSYTHTANTVDARHHWREALAAGFTRK